MTGSNPEVLVEHSEGQEETPTIQEQISSVARQLFARCEAGLMHPETKAGFIDIAEGDSRVLALEMPEATGVKVLVSETGDVRFDMGAGPESIFGVPIDETGLAMVQDMLGRHTLEADAGQQEQALNS